MNILRFIYHKKQKYRVFSGCSGIDEGRSCFNAETFCGVSIKAAAVALRFQVLQEHV